MTINERLTDVYVKNNLVSKELIEETLADMGNKPRRLDKVLLEQRLVTEDTNALAYAELFGMPYGKVSELAFDREIVSTVTQAFVDKYKAIPIHQQDDGIIVFGLADPFSYETFPKIDHLSGGRYKVIVTSEKEINTLKNVVFSKSTTAEAISRFADDDAPRAKSLTETESELYGADVQNAPAVRLTDSLVREAVAYGASDLHIEPYKDVVRVRYRVDGELYEASSFDIELYTAVLTRVKIIAGINIAKKRVPQDGRIRQKVNDKEFDFRVSTLPTIFGERIVIRILDTEAFSFERPQLGFLPEENSKVDYMLGQPYGIILLVGPTGCGKTTTLYSFIRELNQPNVNIVTVEDPIEYTVDGVGQVQVNTAADMTFARALRSILRQDPNIIMIGEIRDEETAQIAIRSAITGHLVFSTLHTNDAPGSVTRLLDMGIEPYFVADAVVGIVAQRLVRVVCQKCRSPHKTTKSEMKILNLDEPTTIYKPEGCPACNNTGYKGRLGIHEIFIMDDELKELVQMRVATERIRIKAKQKGMLTLYDTCRDAVLKGKTTMQELAKIVYESPENE